MTFMESMDFCFRTSMPLLFLALTFLAMSLTMASAAAVKSLPAGRTSWSSNATESAIDYTVNDLLLGSQDPVFWVLVPTFGLISAGIIVVMNYIALATISVLQTPLTLIASWSAGTKRELAK